MHIHVTYWTFSRCSSASYFFVVEGYFCVLAIASASVGCRHPTVQSWALLRLRVDLEGVSFMIRVCLSLKIVLLSAAFFPRPWARTFKFTNTELGAGVSGRLAAGEMRRVLLDLAQISRDLKDG